MSTSSSTISKPPPRLRNKVKMTSRDSKRHKLPPPTTPPFPGILGEWVMPSAFKGKQSSTFGCFDCRKCSKRWSTAHARKSSTGRFFRQGCKQCKQEYFPSYVWLSLPRDEDEPKRDSTDDNKPHLAALCEACRVGQCRSRKPVVRSYSDTLFLQPSSSTYNRRVRSPSKPSCKLCSRMFNSAEALLMHNQAYHYQPRAKSPSRRVDRRSDLDQLDVLELDLDLLLDYY